MDACSPETIVRSLPGRGAPSGVFNSPERKNVMHKVSVSKALCLLALIISLAALGEAIAQSQPKPATEATKAANAAVLKSLPFGNKRILRTRSEASSPDPRNLTIKN